MKSKRPRLATLQHYAWETGWTLAMALAFYAYGWADARNEYLAAFSNVLRSDAPAICENMEDL